MFDSPQIDKCLRQLPADDIRVSAPLFVVAGGVDGRALQRLLLAATCVPAIDDGVDKSLQAVVSAADGDASGKASVSFEPLFQRINIAGG